MECNLSKKQNESPLKWYYGQGKLAALRIYVSIIRAGKVILEENLSIPFQSTSIKFYNQIITKIK